MDVLSRLPPAADHRIAYGPGADQFGDLWLPQRAAKDRAPLVVMIHGGWWKSLYGLGHASFLCAALRASGLAVWSIEYRRVGLLGGGWPVTFQDVGTGFEHATTLATTYPIDLTRIVVAGHSAGSHLAFWLAGRHHIPAGSPLERPQPRLTMHAIVSLAGAVDLQLLLDLARGEFAANRTNVERLMGGSPEQVPDRYLAGDPGRLLPLGVPQYLLQGTEDDQIPPELPRLWAAKTRAQGDMVAVRMLPGAQHLDVIDPESAAWPEVLRTVKQAFTA